MKILSVILTLLVFSISFDTLGHDGHDHQSSFASLIHLLWLAPLFIGLSFLYSKLLNQLCRMDK